MDSKNFLTEYVNLALRVASVPRAIQSKSADRTPKSDEQNLDVPA